MGKGNRVGVNSDVIIFGNIKIIFFNDYSVFNLKQHILN